MSGIQRQKAREMLREHFLAYARSLSPAQWDEASRRVIAAKEEPKGVWKWLVRGRSRRGSAYKGIVDRLTPLYSEEAVAEVLTEVALTWSRPVPSTANSGIAHAYHWATQIVVALTRPGVISEEDLDYLLSVFGFPHDGVGSEGARAGGVREG